MNGWYRFRFQHWGFHLPETGGVWGVVYNADNYTVQGNTLVERRITSFESLEKPAVVECEAWMARRHSVRVRPGDRTLRSIDAAGGKLITEGELKGQRTVVHHVDLEEGEEKKIPGIALDWFEVEKIQRGPTHEEIRHRLFGEIPFRTVGGKPGPEVEKKLQQAILDGDVPTFNSVLLAMVQAEKVEPVTDSVTEEQLTQLMVAMACRAFRRPVTEEDILHCCKLVHKNWEETGDLIASLRIGYRTLLCSSRFLCHLAPVGKLDSYAVASRLSYMLTGSMPDEELARLAAEDKLDKPAAIRKQVERLLSGSEGRRFVEIFADEWLELDQINFTHPDRKLVPDFDFVVQHSMLDETRTYLEVMLRDNLSVRDLVGSHYTYLNSRLARYYGIPGVTGGELRRVTLKLEDHRGGLMTHGSVLKVTANGTQTSPVLRGAWIAKRLLGEQIPPPPPNISAVEPDIRGATTIRELLEKHRDSTACAGCHSKMDPPGFALENFDPGGKWRDHYVQVVNGQRVVGLPIDPGYVLADGRQFQNIQDLQLLLASQPEKLARNLIEKLVAFGTGATVSFADREEVDRMVALVAREDYGFRSIVHAVTTSPLFLNK